MLMFLCDLYEAERFFRTFDHAAAAESLCKEENGQAGYCPLLTAFRFNEKNTYGFLRMKAKIRFLKLSRSACRRDL